MAGNNLISSGGHLVTFLFEAEIISHQLLLKAGYIRRVNSGNLCIHAN
jgi:Prolyl-tRNA synthetase